MENNEFNKLISLENLFLAWEEFKYGKRSKPDVMEFEFNLEKNIFTLHEELKERTYSHNSYTRFYITDPKQRLIRKASVKDRVIHHLIFSYLNHIWDPCFIFDSYSSREGKGTHKGVSRLQKFLKKESKNNSRTCWVLKCDIKKFFDSVDHSILIKLIGGKVKDKRIIWLIKKIIKSSPKGLPIGNVTSQIFANIYMNEFDQFVKHKLKARYYLRYTDDFIFVNHDKKVLEKWLSEINIFLENKLKLSLHPRKISLQKYHQGVDFLGYVQFPNHKILRTKTKQRILKKIKKGISYESLQSYLGVLSHADSHKLSEKIKNLYLFYKK